MKKIKYLVMDVDGTLTDGKIYMGQEGEMAKAFNIKDGCGILLELPKLKVLPVIITARDSMILENRCKEIGITELHQGVKNKLEALRKIVGGDLATVAYAGDDLPDVPCMTEIKKAGGLVLCPSDAIPEIKAIADYISGFRAGDGAIRDCISFLAQINESDNEKKIRRVIDIILSGSYCNGMIDGNPYSIQEYETKNELDCDIESHRKHIDIQYILEGHEEFYTYLPQGLTNFGVYNKEKDVEFWQNGIISTHSILSPGSIIVIYNGQPHKGAVQFKESEKVVKLVCKILV